VRNTSDVTKAWLQRPQVLQHEHTQGRGLITFSQTANVHKEAFLCLPLREWGGKKNKT